MELYIKKIVVVDGGINKETNENGFIVDDKSWDINQWKDKYFVRIVGGTGAGAIGIIKSNNENTLFTNLSFLRTDSVYEIFAVQYVRVELFKDETISITSTIQNYADIGKLFTDYSQSFTIPASTTNNSTFVHWYESSVDNGYDARIRYDAIIKLNGITFREGNLQLEKANKKNGYIESYSITFYGNLTQLKDRFGEDKMNSLDYSSISHMVSDLAVYDRVINTAYTDVFYPLIGNNRRFEYLTGTSSDTTTNAGAIKWDDLFPAVSIPKLFLFIQNKYGITFTGNFLNYGQFSKLYMYMKNMELPRAYNNAQQFDCFRTYTRGWSPNTYFPECNTSTNIITTAWENDLWTSVQNSAFNRRLRIGFDVKPASAFLTVNYKITVYRDGIIYKTFDNLIGNQQVEFYDDTRANDPDDHQYYVTVSSQGSLSYKGVLYYIRDGNLGDKYSETYNYASSGTPTGQLIQAYLNVANYVPDIKVSDFFMGIVKMFNLIITPIDATTFNLQPLELYYQGGQVKDITEYIYSDELDIERPKIYKSLEFKYEKSENILNNAYRSMFNIEYGDLIYNDASISETSKYEVKLPFEDVMWERTSGSNFITATLWNKDLKTYTPKPILMYRNDLTPVSELPITPIKMTTETVGTYRNIPIYLRFQNDIPLGGTDLGYVHTINWGAEVSPYYLTVAPNGLYKRHYEQYIANLYNKKSRVIKVKGKLPFKLLGNGSATNPNELVNLKLNDRIVIRDKRYVINSFTTELSTGETSFELITDFRVLGTNSVGYRFANIDWLNVDNTEQEIQIDLYKGMFETIVVNNNYVGFVNWAENIKNEDLSVVIYIAQNTTGVDRMQNFEVDFVDFKGDRTLFEIPVKQTL
jgi:hypothetical protein